MSKWKKLIIVLVGFVCIVFAVLLILAKTLITPERVREAIVPIVEESLQRELRLGAIEISLFSGIILNDLVLTGHEADESFVTVEKAVLRYRVWPLLLLQVEVDELRLEQPVIHLTRFHDGSFNFSDLTEPADAAVPESSNQSAVSGASPVSVHVSEIVITDGTLVFVDQSATESVQHTLSTLNLTVKDFSLTEPFMVSLATTWNSNNLALAGRFDLDDLATDVTLRMNAIQLEVKGDLLAEAKGDRLRAEINLPAMSVTELLDSIPKEIVEVPALSGLSGQLGTQLILDGLVAEPDNLLSSGRIEINNLTASTGSFHSVMNGIILLERKSLKTDSLSLTINDQLLDVSVAVDNVKQQPLQADFTISSSSIDLDRFIPVADEESEGEASQGGASTEASVQAVEAGPFDLPVELNGTIKVEKMLYRGLPLQNVVARLTLKKNWLTIERLVAAIAGGMLEQSGQVNLGVRGLQYNSQTSLQNVAINPIVKALKPKFSESIFGIVDGQVTISGAGTEADTIKEKLIGNGNFDLKQARLTRMPALDSAAGLLNMTELKEITIDDGHATFRINKGVVDVNLKTNGPQLKQTTNGTVSLAGQLGLKVNLSTSPQLSKKLDHKGVLRDVFIGKDGWGRVPLRIKGDYAAPKVTLDMKEVRQQATRGAIDSLADRLIKKAGGGNKGSETQDKDDPTRKLIDGALKSLFGN